MGSYGNFIFSFACRLIYLFILAYNCFAMLSWLLLCIKVKQLCVYTYPPLQSLPPPPWVITECTLSSLHSAVVSHLLALLLSCV